MMMLTSLAAVSPPGCEALDMKLMTAWQNVARLFGLDFAETNSAKWPCTHVDHRKQISYIIVSVATKTAMLDGLLPGPPQSTWASLAAREQSEAANLCEVRVASQRFVQEGFSSCQW
eukprot:TRINITY_DN68760_c0_g1_i1.p2 TRINITY_DN68760_c0_g1~~TRINITY_DN68760_c0_g1_i1.p2  ORF type:complete len:117 (+),score=16.82 TRINITY_DN68760_c0_g1_i1:223-573(+)